MMECYEVVENVLRTEGRSHQFRRRIRRYIVTREGAFHFSNLFVFSPSKDHVTLFTLYEKQGHMFGHGAPSIVRPYIAHNIHAEIKVWRLCINDIAICNEDMERYGRNAAHPSSIDSILAPLPTLIICLIVAPRPRRPRLRSASGALIPVHHFLVDFVPACTVLSSLPSTT